MNNATSRRLLKLVHFRISSPSSTYATFHHLPMRFSQRLCAFGEMLRRCGPFSWETFLEGQFQSDELRLKQTSHGHHMKSSSSSHGKYHRIDKLKMAVDGGRLFFLLLHFFFSSLSSILSFFGESVYGGHSHATDVQAAVSIYSTIIKVLRPEFGDSPAKLDSNQLPISAE